MSLVPLPLRRPGTPSLRLALLTLEDRVTPSFSIAPPMSREAMQQFVATRADMYTLENSLPPSAIGEAPAMTLADFTPFRLNLDTLAAHLTDAPKEFETGRTKLLALPRPDGTFDRFNVWEVAMMEPGLAAQYPDIRTWRGQGIDDPTATFAADVTALGFHAQVLSPNGRWYVDPYYHLDASVYASYYADDLFNRHGADTQPEQLIDPLGGTLPEDPPLGNRSSNGQTLRTYRTAVAATGEYTAFFGGSVAQGQAAIVTAINRVSAIFETELAVRMVLVANNSLLVYTNGATDPYSNNDGGAMLSQNQTTVDSVIGSANYDLGHVFSTGGGGVAYLGVVGLSGWKARGVTGSGSPVNDAFYVDYVAHEMGHQYDGNHTFNGVNGAAGGNVNSGTAYEPGSGSTIMAYAGICGADDLQPNSDAYFHAISLDEISDFIFTGVGSGFTQTATGNNIPTANAGSDYTIPARTPFALTGSGSDADAGDVLTYTWEQYDLGPDVALNAADNGQSPLFRSVTGTTSPTRNLPRLSTILSGGSSNSEKLPTVAQTMTFRLTVRDNRPTGAYNRDDMNVTVINTGAGFAVTSPNTNVTYAGASTQTVTWNVAGTTAAPINAGLVNILLSTDGGQTFPITLAAATTNDGTEAVVIPNLATSQARIKVQPVGNIFFDIGNANFTIQAVPKAANVTSSAADGTYSVGAVIPITVAFSAAVNVTGSPQLQLNSGGVANYAGGSGTTTLTFDYVVGGGESSTDLDHGVAILLNGGTIKAVSNAQNAELTLPAPGTAGSLGFNKDIVINTSNVPAVTAVTSSLANGNYGAGAVVPIAITFSRTVVVTGTPLLAMNSSGSAVASYVSGSASNTLIFEYTAAATDSSPDLDYDSNTALTLNGGTIVDQATSTDAVLTLPAPGASGSLGANKNIAIIPTPTIANVTSPTANGTYDSGATIVISVDFTGTVVVVGQPELQLNSGGTAQYTSGSGSATLTFTYVVAAGHTSPDLDYMSAAALGLNGGSIKNQSTGVDANVTLPGPGSTGSLGANKNIIIEAAFLTLTSSAYSTDEGAGVYSVTVQRTGSIGALSIDYAVVNGSTENTDYQVVSGPSPLTWADGDSSPRTIDFQINDDNLSEGRESLTINLSNLIGAAELGISSAVLTILQSDGRAPGSFTEPDGDVATVRLAPKTGAGSLLVYLTDDSAPISLLELTGTDPARSVVTVAVKRSKTTTDLGATAVGEVLGSGVRVLNLIKSPLTGGINLSGMVQVVRLHSIANGADLVSTGAALPKKSTRIFVKNGISDGSDIVLAAPLANINTGPFGNGSISVPSLGALTVRGNFSGDINVSGAGVDPVKPALRSLRVTGQVSGSRIDVAGNVTTVTVGSFVDSQLFVGYAGDNVGGGTFGPVAELKRFRTTAKSAGFKNSSVIASTIGSVVLSSLDAQNGGAAFGVYADEVIAFVKILSPFIVFDFPISSGVGDFDVKIV